MLQQTETKEPQKLRIVDQDSFAIVKDGNVVCVGTVRKVNRREWWLDFEGAITLESRPGTAPVVDGEEISPVFGPKK